MTTLIFVLNAKQNVLCAEKLSKKLAVKNITSLPTLNQIKMKVILAPHWLRCKKTTKNCKRLRNRPENLTNRPVLSRVHSLRLIRISKTDRNLNFSLENMLLLDFGKKMNPVNLNVTANLEWTIQSSSHAIMINAPLMCF